MFEILNSYLFQHKSISIPGLGTIVMERLPANTDSSSKNFLPPLYHFRFDKYFDAPDKDFFSYIAAEKNIPDYEAIKWYNEFSHELRNKIRVEEKVKWDDVGVLKKDFSGNIVFESTPGKMPFLDTVPATIVALKDGQHYLRVGDIEKTNNEMNEWLHPEEEVAEKRQTWWIYALALTAAAILILILHFSSRPLQPSSIGNQQTLETSK